MPLLFYPKKSSAHRIACIALYRALLWHTAHIQLPAERLRGTINPIKFLIRKKFRRNRHVTGSRLITTALKIGYEAEELLHRAAEGDKAAHSEVLTLLQEHQAQGDAERARQILHPPPPRPPPQRKPEPWPGARPILETRPRPLSELKGPRRVPKFTYTATVPFLRIRKPQNPYLSRIIRDLKVRSQRQLDNMDMLEEEIRWAEKEDRWDRLVGGALAHSADGGARWVDQLRVVLRQTKQQKKEDQIKSAERARLLVELIDKEKELLAQERKRRKRERKSSLLQGRSESPNTESAADTQRE